MTEKKSVKVDFENFLNVFPVGVAVFDSELKCVWVNEKTCEITGKSVSDIIGKTLLELSPGVEKSSRYEKYLKTLEDGKRRHVVFQYEPVNSSSGKLLIASLDILRIDGHLVLLMRETSTDAKQNIVMNALLSSYPAHILVKGTDFTYKIVNNACAQFHGHKPEEIIGKTDYDIFPKNIADEIREDDKKVLAGRVIENRERPLYNAMGDTMWALSTKTPLKDDDGKVVGIFCISIDITNRKTVEAELTLLSAAVHHAKDTIVVTDTDGTIQYVNPAFTKITGYSLEEAVGQNPSVLKSGEHSDDFYKELWETITGGASWSGHFINKRRNGELYEEDATISPVKNEDGEITNFIGVKRDVTKEVELERQLQHTNRMEAIGRLTGGVAHDFNNILTAILGYGDILLNSMPEDDPNRAKVREIVKAGKRAEALTKQMLIFSRKQIVKKTKFNVNSIVKGMRSMLSPVLGENVEFRVILAEHLPPIMADATQIEQTVLNLVINSKDALDYHKRGKITISTSLHDLESEFNDGDFLAKPGQYVRISVEDNGSGMDKTIMGHMYEPFFSSKTDKSGTGMGLSTVYGIVRQYDGYITVSSEIGKGTVFNVHLPAATDSSMAFKEETHKVVTGKFTCGSGKVLIVEDEATVLDLAATILQSSGYKVETALSASDAEKIFHDLDGEVDLILSDVILTDANGVDLVEKLRKVKPELRALFMSGYVGDAVDRLDERVPGSYFLAKPFSINSLTAAVSEALYGGEDA